MTLFAPIIGKRTPVGLKLTTTGVVSLIPTFTKNKVVTVESLSVSGDNTGAKFSLFATDGTTNFFIVNQRTIAANETFYIKDHHIPIQKGWALKCQADAADHIDVLAITIDSFPEGENDGGIRRDR